jgi:hypothetical protein
MDDMRFLPLAALSQPPLAGDPARGVCVFADVDGRRTELDLLAKQLRGGGLELAQRAFDAGDVRAVCAVLSQSDPGRDFTGLGRRTLHGVTTLVIQPPQAQPAAGPAQLPRQCSADQRALVLEWLGLVEAKMTLDAMFCTLDTNRDGRVSHAELEAAVAPSVADWAADPPHYFGPWTLGPDDRPTSGFSYECLPKAGSSFGVLHPERRRPPPTCRPRSCASATRTATGTFRRGRCCHSALSFIFINRHDIIYTYVML